MGLSTDLISKFVAVTNDQNESVKESTTYGTIVTRNETKRVQLDGSTLLTPIATTTTIDDGERVSVTIKNHQATVMGNVTNPSVRATELDDTNTNITQVEKTVSENDEAYQLQFTNIVNGTTTILAADGESLISKITSLDGKYSQLEQTVDGFDFTGYVTFNSLTDGSTTIDGSCIKTGTISADRIDTSSLVISGYVTDSELTDALSDYTTSSTLKSTLSDYVVENDLIQGYTTIDGGCIKTGTIDSQYLDVSGLIAAGKIVVTSDMSSYLDGYLTGDDVGASGTTVISGDRITTGTINADLISTGTIQSGSTGAVGLKGVLNLIDSSGDHRAWIGAYTGSNGTDATQGVALFNNDEYFNGLMVTNAGASLHCEAKNNGTTVVSGTNYAQNIYVCPAGPTIEHNDGSNDYLLRLYAGTFGPVTSATSTTQSGAMIMCGNSSHKWCGFYSASAYITTSDRNLKHDIAYDLDTVYLDFYDSLKPCRFKYDDGTSDRYHVGFIAQDVADSLENTGLTSQDFAGYVKDEREDGTYEYALRYEEFIALNTMKIKQQEKKIEDLENRLAALEAKLAADA